METYAYVVASGDEENDWGGWGGSNGIGRDWEFCGYRNRGCGMSENGTVF